MRVSFDTWLHQFPIQFLVVIRSIPLRVSAHLLPGSSTTTGSGDCRVHNRPSRQTMEPSVGQNSAMCRSSRKACSADSLRHLACLLMPYHSLQVFEENKYEFAAQLNKSQHYIYIIIIALSERLLCSLFIFGDEI